MNPREVLGVSANATEEEIRAAYLGKVKEHPPERSPEEFEKIRDAWEALRDPRRRMIDSVLSADPFAPAASLFKGLEQTRKFAGPDPWLKALDEHRRES